MRPPPELVLSSVPFSMGTYGTAVACAGPLSTVQTLSLNVGTYCGQHRRHARAPRPIAPATWRAGLELGAWLGAAL